MFESQRYDIGHVCRGLWRAKSFSAATILTLTIGLAGTTVMFSLVRGVLLRPLPVRDQDRLLVAWKELRSTGFSHYPFGNLEIDAVRERSLLLESVAGVDANGAGREGVTENGASGYVKSALVTGDFFDVLDVRPLLGRGFTRADDVDGAEKVLVISHGLWQRRYGASRDAIGRRVLLGDDAFTIVGVMPPDVDFPPGVEMWRTTHSVGTREPFGDAARREIDLVARLRPHATLEQAASELATLSAALDRELPSTIVRGAVPVVRSFEDVVVGDVRRALVALMAAVAFVLLIASANAANLLLMRGEARRSELSVREALGAGRARLVRHVVAESVILASFAALAGVLLASLCLQGLLALVPNGLPRAESVRIDGTVAIVAVAVALLTSVIAALAPALACMKTDIASVIRASERGAIAAAARRERRALVIVQVALAICVLAGAGLLTRTVFRLQALDVGFAADRLAFVDLEMPETRYAEPGRHARFLDAAVAQIAAVPGVDAATPVNVPPFAGDAGWDAPRFAAEGQDAIGAAANPSLNLESVHHTYFDALRIPLVRGRGFTAADREGAPRVAIISDDVAAHLWAGADPLNRRVKFGRPESREPWLTIVGVAASTRYRDLIRVRPTIYLPAPQFLVTAQRLAIRTTLPLDAVAALARDRLRLVDPDVRVLRVASFANLLDGPLAAPRFNAVVLGIFGASALLLTTIGLYAVMSAHVRRRAREIAVRVALGATAGDVRRLVLGEAASLAAVGVALGLSAAGATTRVLRGMLFQIEPLDPSTLAAVALLLLAASMAASYVPLRRASRADPVAALRN